jgi:hypothetical protein
MEGEAARAPADGAYPLAPHYLVHIGNDGMVLLPYTQAKQVLDRLKRLCLGRELPDGAACGRFDRTTRHGEDMRHPQRLLAAAVASVVGKNEERAVASLFSQGGTHALKGEFDGPLQCFGHVFAVRLPSTYVGRASLFGPRERADHSCPNMRLSCSRRSLNREHAAVQVRRNPDCGSKRGLSGPRQRLPACPGPGPHQEVARRPVGAIALHSVVGNVLADANQRLRENFCIDNPMREYRLRMEVGSVLPFLYIDGPIFQRYCFYRSEFRTADPRRHHRPERMPKNSSSRTSSVGERGEPSRGIGQPSASRCCERSASFFALS